MFVTLIYAAILGFVFVAISVRTILVRDLCELDALKEI
jgi:hypothetical protein